MALDGIDTGRDEDGHGDVACVFASLADLSADEVDANLERHRDMFRGCLTIYEVT